MKRREDFLPSAVSVHDQKPMGMKHYRVNPSNVGEEFPEIMGLENTTPIMTMHLMDHIREVTEFRRDS
jgi:hypothetical protein